MSDQIADYPSREAMAAAVTLEVHAALGRVQTVVVGRIIQREALDPAITAERSAAAAREAAARADGYRAGLLDAARIVQPPKE